VVTGVLGRFPGLKVVFVEPGLAGRVVSGHHRRHGHPPEVRPPGITELPSFYFHRNVFLTFIEEPDAVQLLRHRLGTRNIMWSTDYPHPVSSWPNSRKIAEEQTAGMSAVDRDLVLAGNAARVWNL
jgi:predicted TIM-barrel fold metal-dependent hydrolase